MTATRIIKCELKTKYNGDGVMREVRSCGTRFHGAPSMIRYVLLKIQSMILSGVCVFICQGLHESIHISNATYDLL